MLKFTFLHRSKQWAVVGPADEVHVGVVWVPNNSGQMKTERVIKVSEPFSDSDGSLLRLGFLSVLPRGRKTKV
jgi:hypothetical protein